MAYYESIFEEPNVVCRPLFTNEYFVRPRPTFHSVPVASGERFLVLFSAASSHHHDDRIILSPVTTVSYSTSLLKVYRRYKHETFHSFTNDFIPKPRTKPGPCVQKKKMHDIYQNATAISYPCTNLSAENFRLEGWTKIGNLYFWG